MMVVSFVDWSLQYNRQRAVVTQFTGFTMIYKDCFIILYVNLKIFFKSLGKIHKKFIKPKQFRLVPPRLIQSVARRNDSCLTTANRCRNVIRRLHLLTTIHRKSQLFNFPPFILLRRAFEKNKKRSGRIPSSCVACVDDLGSGSHKTLLLIQRFSPWPCSEKT